MLWREKSPLSAAGLPEPPELPLQPKGAHRSQTQHCPALHMQAAGVRSTAGAGGWVKTLLARGKTMGKGTCLLQQEGSCSGDCTGRPG